MEIRRRTKPVSNSVVGSATTVPDARLRPEPSDRSLRIRASLSRPFRGERRRPAARGPPPDGEQADFPRAPHTKRRGRSVYFDRAITNTRPLKRPCSSYS
jgi:hypothetical protein